MDMDDIELHVTHTSESRLRPSPSNYIGYLVVKFLLLLLLTCTCTCKLITTVSWSVGAKTLDHPLCILCLRPHTLCF